MGPGYPVPFRCLPRPHRIQRLAWSALVQEFHIYIGDGLIGIANYQALVTGEDADNAGLNLLDGANIEQLLDVFRRNCQYHALLGLRKPDFPGSQSLIFKWGLFQFDIGSRLSAHFANSRGETARTTIRNGGVKLSIPCLDDDIGNLLLSDRRTYLHCAASLRIYLAAHLSRGKSGAVNSIAAGTSTQHDDAISRLYVARVTPLRQHTQAPTEDKRVIKIPFIIKDGTVNGRHTHLIAIVTYAVDYTAGDTPGWKNTCRKILDRCIRRAKAEDISAGNWLRRDAQYIANDTAHAGVCSAERLYGRGMIMRLDLDGEILCLRKANNTGVVAKG